MNVGEAVAASVARHGVTVCFGVLGNGNAELVAPLASHGVRYVAARREDGAVAMADGCARAGGGVGLATVTLGPGVTNAITAVTEATRAGTPIVVMTGETSDAASNQRFDQRAVVAPTGAAYFEVGSAASCSATVADAFEHATVHSCPVVISVPVTLQSEPFEAALVGPRPAANASPLSADPMQIAAAAAVLRESERPVLLAGRGAINSTGRAAVVRLASASGALLATTIRSRGLFDDDPWSIGVGGGFGSLLARSVLAEADCVVAFGASLNHYTTTRRTGFGSARVVHVDSDAANLGRWFTPELAVHGDAAFVANAMADLFEADLSSVRFRTTEIAARLGSHDRAGEFEDASDDRGGDLRAYALAFDDILPTDRIVAVDVGHFTSEIVRYVSVTRPDRLVFAVNFGSVGLGLATGLGAALAGTDSPVFAFVGDGGLMMSIQELETAARAQIPLTVIVMNDGGYGAEVHKLRSLGYGGELARFDNPDLVALAGVLGADALRVTSVQQLRESRDHLAATNGPLLVDVQLNPDVRTDWYGEQLERKAVTPST